jgi:putative DNA primase/helicase
MNSNNKNDVLVAVTSDFVNQLSVSTISDLDNVQQELLKKIHEDFDIHNSIAAKDEKWRKPEYLEAWQISEIMRKIFSIRNICCCPQNTDEDYDLLGIYVDDFVVSIINDDSNYGIYITSDNVIKSIAKHFKRGLSAKEQEEVLSDIKMYAERVMRCNDRDLIAVNNGIFHYDTKTLESFSPEHVFLTKSHVDYIPSAVNPVIHDSNDDTDWDVESWMADLNDDPEIVNLLWEIIGAIIRPNVRWNKSAWLYSDTGNNGKGTLCELMRSICGNTSYAAIPLSDFSKDFALEPLTRASAIIVDENDVGTFIDKCANIKAVITNDVIQINRKFKTPIAYQFYGFMVQCLNEMPKIKDKSESFYRRQLFIPMNKCFTGIEKPYIKNDYLHRKEVLEYVLKRVLEMNYYKLSEPESCTKALGEYKEFNDPVRQYWSEFRDKFIWDLLPFDFLYDLYIAWDALNNPSGKPLSKPTFVNDLLQVIRNDKGWRCDDKNKPIRYGKNKVTRPEPLIVDYNLRKWMSSYKGSNRTVLNNFEPNPNDVTRGLERIILSTPNGSN